MKKHYLVAGFVSVLALVGTSYAGGKHDHDHDNHGGSHQTSHDSEHSSHDMDHGMGDMFLVKKHIDGYDVSFHVMEAQKGMEHGGSHNFMIKIEEGGKVMQNVKINSKVVHPNGNAESKPLMKMGDWFMNGYDLGHSGNHQLMVLFKTAGGIKHKGGVYYSK